MIPGRVTINVINIRTAFAMPAVDPLVQRTTQDLPRISTERTCQREPLVQQIPCCLSAIFWDFILNVLDNHREGKHEDAHKNEEAIADPIGQEDLVRHREYIIGVGPDPRKKKFSPPLRLFLRNSCLFSSILYYPMCIQLTAGVRSVFLFPSRVSLLVMSVNFGEIDLQLPAPRYPIEGKVLYGKLIH